MKKFLLMGLVLLFLSAFVFAEEAKKKGKAKEDKKSKEMAFAHALFPANGRINPNEGTVEAWVSLSYSADNVMLTSRSSVRPMNFFTFVHRDELKKDGKKKSESEDPKMNIHIWTGQEQSLKNRLMFGSNIFSLPRKNGDFIMREISVDIAEFEWKKGEWYFVAFGWKKTESGFDTFLFVQGKRIDQSFPEDKEVSFPTDLDDFVISMGDNNRYAGGKGAIEVLKISKKFKTEEELNASMNGTLAKDESTLFLFDQAAVAGMKKSNSTSILGKDMKVDEKGVLIGPHKIISGKKGKAIQFFE
ncbi:MAG TPA: hypothetical protein PK821_00735 [Victivallales bacterium]|nr:hypothetical protein [Victivallales bacterium]